METRTLSAESEASLLEYRTAIDAIDDRLIALLKERIAIVRNVGMLKASEMTTDCFIRPAREAEIIRRIYAEFQHTDFHPHAAIAIWRQIIAASTHLESKLSITAPELDPTSRHVLATFFGESAEYDFAMNLQESITDFLSGESNILAINKQALEDHLTVQKLHENRHAKLFLKLPFYGTGEDIFCFARLLPEDSGEETHVIAWRDDVWKIIEIADATTAGLEEEIERRLGKNVEYFSLGHYAKPIEEMGR